MRAAATAAGEEGEERWDERLGEPRCSDRTTGHAWEGVAEVVGEVAGRRCGEGNRMAGT